MKDLRVNRILDSTAKFIKASVRDHNTWQRNRLHPLPQSKAQLKTACKAKEQLKTARKAKRQLEARIGIEAERNQRLQEIHTRVFDNGIRE